MSNPAPPHYVVDIESPEGVVSRVLVPVNYHVHISSSGPEPLEHELLTPRDILVRLELQHEDPTATVLFEEEVHVGGTDTPRQ